MPKSKKATIAIFYCCSFKSKKVTLSKVQNAGPKTISIPRSADIDGPVSAQNSFYQVPDYGKIKKMYNKNQLCKYIFQVSEQHLLYCFCVCVCKDKFIMLIN